MHQRIAEFTAKPAGEAFLFSNGADGTNVAAYTDTLALAKIVASHPGMVLRSVSEETGEATVASEDGGTVVNFVPLPGGDIREVVSPGTVVTRYDRQGNRETITL